ncbi:unnamed protein product [Oreochromis niloticus]|nr:unnamed protein product [Mustela putorius furo]
MVDNVSFSGDGAPSQHDTPVFSSSVHWECRVCPPAVPLRDAALTADPYFPLKSFEVELEVRDHVATVVSTLNYENKEDKPLEAVFVFPLPGDAAVCHFSAQVGQTQIVAELKEKQKARQEYDDALSSGSEGAGVQVTSVPASLVPYSLSFSARVSSPRPVSKVESNCSLDPLQYLNTDPTQATVKLAAGHKFDRDVELLIYYKDAHQPTAVVEAGQASAEPGSLMGDPVVMWIDLEDTLLLLLKSLPMGCDFNIYSCGSSYEQIFPKSVEYGEKTMEEALKKVEQMEADHGGTEILEPLKHIYSQPCIQNQPRQKPPRDPLLQLVSLQKASGCWLLDAAVAAALGKTNEEVEKSKPEKASSEVWATILALIWLHGFKMDAKDEWELLAAKAVSWLSAQKAPSVTECVEARNILLGCSVQKDCPWPLRFLLS